MDTTSVNYVYTAESKRCRLVEGADLISDMPEIIINHILSSLPTKDAVKTSVLSRNWKYKWTCITNVDVSDASIELLEEDRWMQKVAVYVRFLHRFIALSENSRISRFRLYFPGKYSNLLQSWITKLLRRNVQHLDITAPYIEPTIVSSSWLSGWTSLIDLKLYLNCTLSVSTVNCFPNLKSLNLQCTTLESSARHVLMNFPILESLILADCKWLDVDYVVIQAPSLITFRISYFMSKGPKKYIKLCAPKLDEFVSCHGEIRNIVLRAPAVTHASIYSNDTEDALPSYTVLNGFPNLKSLTLSGGVIKAFIESRLIFAPSTIHRVKEFKGCYFWGPDRNILEFLQVMPYLESLDLNIGSTLFKNDSEYSGEIPSFLYLKELKFDISMRKTNELDIVESILKKSNSLEKLFVLACKKRKRERKGRILHSWLSKIMTTGSRCVVHVDKP